MSKKKIDNIFISAPENVSWLLNLRGYDNPNSPIPNCRLILSKSRELYLFSSKYKILNIKDKIPLKVNFYEENDFYFVINKLKGINFSIDEISCSIYFEKLISSKFYINTKVDPCYYFKSIKNVIELNNMEKAHIEDGVALTKFLYWIKNSDVKKLDELKVEKKLENFRKRNKNYLYPSFNTIAGSGPNGAIIHYRANKKSNRKIRSSDIFLCDSGGQYKYGTTDVTRTICFEKPKKRIKDIFTRVLKGHIAVVSANLNKVNKGNELDAKARYWLNKKN
jgi:Xaa-Pro aminopeptidase